MSGLTGLLEHPSIQGLVKSLDEAFVKAPKLPKGLVDFFVTIAPYMAMLGAVLSIIAGPLMAIVSLVSILTLSPMIMLSTVVSTVMLFVQAVILFMAFKPLQERAYKGWHLLFVSNLLSIVQTVLNLIFSMNASGLVGSVIGTIIGLYVLFQMKPSYKK
jgi:hypothetical protein